jgi:hypothetical protein
MWNLPEGIMRHCINVHFSIGQLNHIFFTEISNKTIGGLFGKILGKRNANLKENETQNEMLFFFFFFVGFLKAFPLSNRNPVTFYGPPALRTAMQILDVGKFE